MTRDEERNNGFVLIGVVMFVLALTILGMSLYVLSSYEVEFLGATHDDNTALYAAESGMQMVEDLLADTPYKLESSHVIETTEHIVRATAYQYRPGHPSADSTGAVNFDSTVTIVVVARVNQSQRIISGSFKPKQYTSWYKRLFTVVDGVTCDVGNVNGQSTLRRVFIPAGEAVWQGSADSTWATTQTNFGPPRLVTQRTTPTTPVPPVSAFVDMVNLQHGGGTQPNYVAGGGGVLTLDNPNAGAVYFGVIPGLGGSLNLYDYNPPSTSTLNVGGDCVWVVPHGVRFEGQVAIHNLYPGRRATLVIVSGPNLRDMRYGNYMSYGIWFFGGMQVDADVNLILVSDGTVAIDQGVDASGAVSVAPNLSVYANDLYLNGPSVPSGNLATLQHNGVPGQLDAAIDDLILHGALPVVNGPASSFQLVAGSWQDLGH